MLMKKTFTSFLLVLFSFLMTANTVGAQPAKAIQSADKDKINGAVLGMLSQWDSQAYKNALDLLTQLMKYDMKVLGHDAYKRMLAMKAIIDGTPDYRLLFGADVLTGHFTVSAEGDRWVKVSDADDLQFTFNDKDGKPCVVTFTTSGATKTISLPVSKEEEEGEDSEEDVQSSAKYLALLGLTIDNIKTLASGVTRVDMVVPEHTQLIMTQGSTTLLNGTVDVDLSSLNDGESVNALVLSINAIFAKSSGTGTFELSLKDTGYKPVMGANIDFTAKSDGQTILATKLSVPGTWKGLNLQTLDFGLESISVNLDVMGQVQLKGGIASIREFLITMMSADNSDEESYKAGIDQVNQKLDLKLYYDGSNTAAGWIMLQPYYDEEEEEWSVVPVICFTSDNSVYPVTEFFSAENFPDVLMGVATIVSELQALSTVFEQTVEERAQDVKAVNGQTATATEWYTLDGKRTTGAAKGLKIMRMSDGTVRKVMVK